MAEIAISAVLTGIMSGMQAQQASKARKKALAKQAEAAKLSNDAAEKDAAAEINRINSQRKLAEKDKKSLLQSKIASQRARMAASGVSGYGGSSDAIFNGLTSKSNEAIENVRALDSERISSIKNNLAVNNKKSLLGIESQSYANKNADFKAYSDVIGGFANDALSGGGATISQIMK